MQLLLRCLSRLEVSLPTEEIRKLSEFLNTLPVKLLLRFRSVCKSWKSLIHNSDFIAHYSSQHQHLLVRYKSLDDSKQEYVSFVDDDNFPQHRVCVTVLPLVNNLQYPLVIGSSHGLLCLYCISPPGGKAAIWNPSIRKAVAVGVPHVRIPEYPSFPWLTKSSQGRTHSSLIAILSNLTY
ncbi:putative F-box domain-containing protein [Helianthus annuus]|nr:putative F-box domain-containing protein [Helianthus annuus]